MIRVSKALIGGAGRQFAQKNRRALRCAKHSNEPLKRKSCQQRLPRFLSLISMAQKSFTPILLRKLTIPFSAGLLTPRTLNKTIKHPCLPLPLWLPEQHAEPEPLLLVAARAVRRAGATPLAAIRAVRGAYAAFTCRLRIVHMVYSISRPLITVGT